MNASQPLAMIAAGTSMFTGLWPFPADVAAVQLVLDDGSVVTPQLIDVRSIVNAVLLYIPKDYPGRSIASVEATTR